MNKAKEISALWSQIKPQIGEMVRLCHEVENHAEVTADAYQRGYENGFITGHQRGMADANRDGEYNADDGWYVMQKISLLPNPIKTELFGTAETAVILQGNSFKDALAKLVEYEQKKQEEDAEIKVGDEVEAVSGKAVIIEVLGNGKDVRYMYPDASTGFNDSCNVTRTGRHFPEIAEVLQKMREGQEQ